MDFLHRNPNNQPREARGDAGGSFSDAKRSSLSIEPSWLRVLFVFLLFSLTVLGIALTSLMYFGRARQANYVNKDLYQAVFLTNGQVYFGQVKGINDQYVDVQDIYYLNSQQGDSNSSDSSANNQATNFSLVKLGCELHGPKDQMIINREQVSFWENIRSDGKVAQAISRWKTENPNGQECKTTSSTTQQSTGSNGTGTGSTSNSSTGSSSSTH